jgi:hypothetical protein
MATMFATSACFCAARSCGVLQAEVANKAARARPGTAPAWMKDCKRGGKDMVPP